MYSNGESERILGKAIKQLGLPRDEIVVMTKVRRMSSDILSNNDLTCICQLWGVVGHTKDVQPFHTRGLNPDEHGYVNQHGLRRKHIFDSVKHSLERLQLDYVDVLQCHRFDPDTPIEETVGVLP